MADNLKPKPAFGTLIINTGTPEAPTTAAVRRFLTEFLSDPRVIKYPRWLWIPILHGIILNTRPLRSARLYQEIWTQEGSPLIGIVQDQVKGIQELLEKQSNTPVKVSFAMRYSSPSIASALREFRDLGIHRILVVPLFPQFSGTTTASALDMVFEELKSWQHPYSLRTISGYHNHPLYIQALASSIQRYWDMNVHPGRLLFSFHGIPQSYSLAGDPYEEQCRATATLVAEKLGVDKNQWQISFQSRFGPQAWLQPYTDKILESWGHGGIKKVYVVCPGFSADCLETLREIDREGREIFKSAGGGEFVYIPALNANPDHIRALVEIIRSQLEGWL